MLPAVKRFRSPTFFGISGFSKRRGLTFFPVSKTFSTKRFPRNTERVIGENRDKGECTEESIFCEKKEKGETLLTYFNKGRFRNEAEQEVAFSGENWNKKNC